MTRITKACVDFELMERDGKAREEKESSEGEAKTHLQDVLVFELDLVPKLSSYNGV